MGPLSSSEQHIQEVDVLPVLDVDGLALTASAGPWVTHCFVASVGSCVSLSLVLHCLPPQVPVSLAFSR